MAITEPYRNRRAASKLWTSLLAVLALGVICASILIARGTAQADGNSFEWTGQGISDNWTDSCNWYPKGACQEDYPGNDDQDDEAVIELGTVQVPDGLTLRSLTVANKTPGTPVNLSLLGGSITLTQSFNWTGGVIRTSIDTTTATNISISGRGLNVLGNALTNRGTARLKDQGQIRLSGHNVAKINNAGTFEAEHGTRIDGEGCCVSPSELNNTGTWVVDKPLFSLTAPTMTVNSLAFTNTGTIDVRSGAMELRGGPATMEINSKIIGSGRVRVAPIADLTVPGIINVSPASTLEVTGIGSNGGELKGTATIGGGGTFEWTGGDISGTLNIPSNSTLTIRGAETKLLTGIINNAGTTTLGGPGRLILAGPATINNSGRVTAYTGSVMQSPSCCVNPRKVYNTGTFTVDAAPNSTISKVVALFSVGFDNSGTVEIKSGALQANSVGYKQTKGTTKLSGGGLTTNTLIDIQSGTLVGTGAITGAVKNAGIIAPGAATPDHSVGTLTITGLYTQTSTGTLKVDLKGTAAGTDFDQLKVGAATLAGTLDLWRESGFDPAEVVKLPVVTLTSRAGTFDALKNGALPAPRMWYARYNSSDVTLRVMISFPGLNRSTAAIGEPLSDPADTTLVKLPTRVLEGNNLALRLFDATGNVVETAGLRAFFSAGPGKMFDPKVHYDGNAVNRRAYVVALQSSGTDAVTGKSRIWLAVSRKADPTSLNPGEWCRYSFDGKRNGGTSNSSFADYPSIATGDDALVISTLQYTFVGDRFTYAVVRVLNKLTLADNSLACPRLPTVHALQASNVVNDAGNFILQPVSQLTSPSVFAGTKNPVYLLSSSLGSDVDYGVWRIRNGASGVPALERVWVNSSEWYRLPPKAPQMGSATTLDTGDTRMLQAVSVGDTITGVHATGCDKFLEPRKACVRVVRIKVGQDANGKLTGSVDQVSTIRGPGDVHYFHPGVAVNKAGQATVVFLQSGASSFLSIGWAMKDAAQSEFPPTSPLATGNCAKESNDRTGDYVGAHTDPVDRTTYWFAGERNVKRGTDCMWHTHIGEVKP